MKRQAWLAALVAASLFTSAHTRAATPTTQPDEFRDTETGLRIVRMSRVPNERAGVIYFTQGTATADSRRVLFHTQFGGNDRRHLYAFDLQTGAITPLVTDRLTANQDFSPRSNNVYYLADHAVWSVNFDHPQPRKIADLPADWSTGAGVSVNADETLVAGSTELNSPTTRPAAAPATGPALPNETQRLKSIGSTFNAHRNNLLYTVNLKTGEVKVIHRIDTWLGHVQFSPTDPGLLMFCHEGPWEKVDRIWTIRMGDAEPTCAYKRTDPHEIAGHESWAPDGKAIWFQNTFRTQRKGYLASKDLTTGQVTRYAIPPGGGAIHESVSPDGTFFVGDGTGKQPTGPDKYLTVQFPAGDTLKIDRLASLQANDYAQCEPNPHLTPDQHWCVFTATFGGPPQAWALEMPPKYWRK